MSKKKSPSGDKIVLKLFPRSGKLMEVTHVQSRKKMPRKKVKVKNPKRSVPAINQFFFANIAGLPFLFPNDKSRLKIFKRVKYGDRVQILHEPKNKFDENACSVYLGKTKIGYLPRDKNAEFLDRTLKGEIFVFYIYNEIPFDELSHEFDGRPGIVGIRCK